MGDLMAGIGFALFGVILFQVAETFFRYPAQTETKPSWTYFILKAVSYFLFGVGAVFLVMGFL